MEVTAQKELYTAWTKVKQQLIQPDKNQTNPFLKNKYADLGACTAAANKACEGTGISWFQNAANSDRGVSVQTIITHTSGQYVVFDPLSVPVDKQNAQGLGSATTYARRYSLCAVFGIFADDDDDGNAATRSDEHSQGNSYNNRPSQTNRSKQNNSRSATSNQRSRQAPNTSSTKDTAKEAAIEAQKKALIVETERIAKSMNSDGKTVLSTLFAAANMTYSQKSWGALTVAQLNHLVGAARKMGVTDQPDNGGKA